MRGEATSDELLVNGYWDQGLPGRGSLCDQPYHVISRLHTTISMKFKDHTKQVRIISIITRFNNNTDFDALSADQLSVFLRKFFILP